MKKVIVFGSGMVGREIAKDLSRDFNVTAVDYSDNILEQAFSQFPSINKIKADLSNSEKIQQLAKGYDIGVGALPGFMGKMCLKSILKAGVKNIVDISFFPEDPFDLDDLAKDNGATAIVDFGVAPGMSNLLFGYQYNLMKSVDNFLCYVGGLPVVRRFPFEYKAGFSPIDVIEEYTRPARYVENGKEVIRPALSDCEYVDFPEIGTLEAFNTDGLRTLAKTIDCPNMKEKTLRYPGHAKFMLALREAGFFSKKNTIEGTNLTPLDFTSKIMFPKWKLDSGEEEFTVMRIIVDGTDKNDNKISVTYDLFDRFDKKNGISSMARTTGFTCAAGVRLLAFDLYNKKGISPPEFLGKHSDCVEFILGDLSKHNVEYKISTI